MRRYLSYLIFRAVSTHRMITGCLNSGRCLFILFSVIFFAGSFPGAFAQTYPVQVITQLAPPYSMKLSDYTAATTDRIAFNVFADIERSELQVKFRLKIEGQNVTATTRPDYNPPPVTIRGGMPERFTGYDLSEYFNPANLNFQGMTRQQFMKTGSLPEGFYRFQLEVLEYNRGTQISNTGTANAWLILNDPPIVNLPRQDEKLKPQSPQNVLIQWTPRHTGSPNSAFATEYEVTMVEVWPAGRNPNDAILTSQPIFQTTTQSTTIVYGPAETPLELGRRYAFRVRARSMVGVEEMDLFKNNGYSEVISFVYGDACDLPTGIRAESLNSTRFNVYWDGQLNHTAYKMRYRLADDNTAQWFENNTVINESEVTSLKANTKYEYQVAGVCGLFDGPYSTVATITTKEAPPIEYSCGLPMETFNLDPASLVASLKVGDVIQAGDFDVELVKVSGSDGTFSGEGVIEVPYFNRAKVKTEFTSITVSKDLRMVNGYMNVTGAAVEVVPEGLKDAMAKLDEALDVIDSALTTIEENLPESFDPGSFVADTLITVKDGISDVYKNPDGSVVIVHKDGTKQQLPAGTSAAIKDDDGNGYLVDKKGNVHKTTADVAAKAGNREYNLLLKFVNNDRASYGFDEQKHASLTGYETLENGYKVAWKSMASNATDVVTAKLLGATELDTRKIHFEMGGVTLSASPAISNNQSTNVTLIGKTEGMEEGMIAVYAASDTGKVQVLGKVNVVTYDEIQKTVVIVPVNGATYPYSITTLRDSLNRIYGQAVVKWTVESEEGIEGVSIGSPFDDGETGLLSNYTSDMKKVINAYKDNMDDDKLYLFLIGGSTKNNRSLAGYMPRSKQAGFIFIDQAGTEKQLIRVMGHELGHGAFNLAHTFSEQHNPLPEKTTDNLMDYTGGQKLYKFQWDKMRYPDIVIGMFEEDEDAQEVIVQNITALNGLKNSKGSFTFITPTGKPFTLPGDISEVIFYSNDESDESTDVGFFPDGALRGFTLKDGKSYRGFLNANDRTEFLGYSVSSTAASYVDDQTKSFSSIDEVVVGLPCINNGVITFKVRKAKYSGDKISENHTGKGTYLNTLPVTDIYTLDDNSSVELEYVSTTPYGDGAKEFLSNVQSCSEVFTKYVLTVANIIDRNKDLIKSCPGITWFIKEYAFAPQCTTCVFKPKPLTENDYLSKVRYLRGRISHVKWLRDNITTITDAQAMRDTLRKTPMCEYYVFSAEQRLYILDVLRKENMYDCGGGVVFFSWLNEHTVAIARNCAEEYAAQIFESTPPEQRKDLLDGLMKNKLLKSIFTSTSGVDGVQGADIATHVYNWMSDLKYNKITHDQALENGNAHKLWEYAAAGMFQSESVSNFFQPYSDFNDDGDKIGYFIPAAPGELACRSCPTQEGRKSVPLNQWVAVYAEEDIKDLGLSKGQSAVIPAIYLHWFVNNQKDKYVARTIRMGFDVIMLMTPGALISGGSRFVVVITLADWAVAGADLAIVGFENEIIESLGQENGTVFIEEWNSFIGYYAAARILTPIVYNNALRLHNTIQRTDFSRIPTGFRERYTKVKEKLETLFGRAVVLTLEELEQSIKNSLLKRGLTSMNEIDDIILNAEILDDALRSGNRILQSLDEMLKNPNFKNHESMWKFFDDAVKSPSHQKGWLTEFETALELLREGKVIALSKEFIKGGDEVDVTNYTDKILIEAKRISGKTIDAIKNNINSIIGKYNDPSRLSNQTKELFGPATKRYGLLEIESTNSCYNFTKTQFMNEVKKELLDKISGIKLDELKNVDVMIIKNGNGTFEIKNIEW